MWRNPDMVTNAVAEHIWAVLMKEDFRHVRLNVNPEYDLAGVWYGAIVEKLSEYPMTFERFALWFRDFMVAEVARIESGRLYSRIPGIQARPLRIKSVLASNARVSSGAREAVFTIFKHLSACVFALLGSEGRTLIGVKNDTPIWKSAPRVTGDELYRYLNVAPMISLGLIESIDGSDEWLVPTYREFSQKAFSQHINESGYSEVNANLIEEAFYKQRYTVDPEGVFVKLTNAQAVTGLFLKVKPSSHRDSLIEVFARVETSGGAIVVGFSEERFLNPEKDFTQAPMVGSYIAYLVCQVYHDLVTCVDVPVAKKQYDNAVRLAPGKSRDNISWTIIPRRVKKVVREPRLKISNPTIMEPRRVTGHLRKVSMTDAHREALLKFERDTGLQVLRFIPEGHTFVRPHISPRTTDKELASLPRFIRYRIQQSLEEAMRKKDFQK